MHYDSLIFSQLVVDNLIPESGVFIITDTIKEAYVNLYSTFKGEGNLKTLANKRYALKLAGLSLLKLNESRSKSKEEFNKTKSGIVYLISNPAFPGYLKVGITKNLKKRLASYQTYDPFRQYKVEHYLITENAREFEKQILTNKNIDLAKGEWIKDNNVRAMFHFSSVGRANDC